MELKVWVDGVQRVVCGVSEQTTCQEVVIALAQAIGQTGRYVLIQKLRDTERQLLASERPLEFLAKCGQYANDVQFILRRTGPSVSERPSSDDVPQPPERTLVRASLPIKPRPVSTEIQKRKEPKKSMTFNLGPIESSPSSKRKQNGTNSKEKAMNVQPSKDELFKMLLQQQEQLHSLEVQKKSLDSEINSWEHHGSCEQEEELLHLEQVRKRNEAELSEEEFWQSELRIEKDHEKEMLERLGSLQRDVDNCTHSLTELSTKIKHLEKGVQLQGSAKLKNSKASSQLRVEVDSKEILAKIKAEIKTQNNQSLKLENDLSEMEKTLQQKEKSLQVKTQELEELNKELRQCNLQQFILQTGATVTVLQSRSEEDEETEFSYQTLPDSHRNGGAHISSTNSPPQPVAKQYLRNPRSLQKPLVSNLKSEVISSRQSTWR
ncbi:ras association domain-containing protein 8 [Latimeria chalumnae]|uniref:Ras association domain family member 7 n=1 Tax=Latimeria chalumnae TaxID=7897 RepID=H3BFT1_LATCH|nr:PREDICTED: ras association domain-containing protein 7 [Latimeria chalumnae]XP_014349787.1 PREDICTED: ras association domain-containing protein 7 [Latimeria chalumnae]XP_014349793.1 PREDICTED: ras association domain-containing protein 7 [Latimeria chalumnae]|eukprot:XP_014349781.1 PREDICTED: ras association domain-containing protein 7 [Latimeria chalumnae]